MINNSIGLWYGVGKRRRILDRRSLEPTAQYPPSSPNSPIGLCIPIASPGGSAHIVLRKAPHEEQGLGRNVLGGRSGENCQATTRHGRILLHSQALLPSTQCPQHLIRRFPVDDGHRFESATQLLPPPAHLVVRLGRGIRA